MESLRDEPGVIWRHIGSRIALTRVSQGDRDANGRSTLRFDTLLAESGNAALRSQVAELCTGKWHLSGDGVAVTARQPTPTGPVNAARISEVVLAARDGSRVIVPADELTLYDASRIIQYASDIPGFSLCYKSLNKQAPVSVNIVAMAVSETIKLKSERNPTPVSRPPSRPPARPASQQSRTPLMLVVILVALAVQTIVLWNVGGARSGETDESNMQGHIIDRIELVRSDFDNKIAGLENAILDSQKEHGLRFKKIAGQLNGLAEASGKLTSQVKTNHKDLAECKKAIESQRQEMSDNESKAETARTKTKESLEELDALVRNMPDEVEKKLERHFASGSRDQDSSENAKESGLEEGQ